MWPRPATKGNSTCISLRVSLLLPALPPQSAANGSPLHLDDHVFSSAAAPDAVCITALRLQAALASRHTAANVFVLV